MKGAAPMDVTSALASAPVHARAQHGGRSRPETGTADAGSFGAVLSDVQGAPGTGSDKTAGSALDVGAPSADKKADHDSAVPAPDMASTAAASSDGTVIGITAVNAPTSVAGSPPPATPAQHGAPLAAAGPGTPDVQDVSTSPAGATAPLTAAVAPAPGLSDPRLSLPAPTAAKSLSPAESATAVPVGAAPAPHTAAVQPPAATGSVIPFGAAGPAAPGTPPNAVPRAVGATGAVGAPVTAPMRGIISEASPTPTATAAGDGATSASTASFPGAVPAETRPSASAGPDKTAAGNTAPAVPTAALAAGTAAPATTPAGQPPSASVPSAAPQPAPAAPQAAQTLQPQLAKPLFTLAGAPHGQHVMTLKVSPEDLGPLTVRAHIGAAGVRIEIFAPGDAGRDAVRGILPELRKELTDAGFGASLDLSEHSGPGGAGQDRAGQGTAGQEGAGADPGGNNAGRGGRNGSGEPRPGSRWDALADAAALRSARTLNGPQATLDILV